MILAWWLGGRRLGVLLCGIPPNSLAIPRAPGGGCRDGEPLGEPQVPGGLSVWSRTNCKYNIYYVNVNALPSHVHTFLNPPDPISTRKLSKNGPD